MLNRLFRPRPARLTGRALYASCVEQARSPALYTAFGAPDTPTGRFEVYTLHIVALLDRLGGHGPQAAETAQALFDTYVKALDHALRELGVGDLSVGKKMRKLGEAFFGRAKSYQAAYKALPDRTELEALIARTVYVGGGEASKASELAAYAAAQREYLEGQPLDEILAGRISWRAA